VIAVEEVMLARVLPHKTPAQLRVVVRAAMRSALLGRAMLMTVCCAAVAGSDIRPALHAAVDSSCKQRQRGPPVELRAQLQGAQGELVGEHLLQVGPAQVERGVPVGVLLSLQLGSSRHLESDVAWSWPRRQ
jgi:hypothetical protein